MASGSPRSRATPASYWSWVMWITTSAAAATAPPARVLDRWAITRTASAERWVGVRVIWASSRGSGSRPRTSRAMARSFWYSMADEAVVFGGEDGIGDRIEPALEVPEAVHGDRLGEGPALDLFLEPVIGILGGELVSEALDGPGDILEPGLGGVVHQQRVRLGPGLREAFPVGIGEQVEVVHADPPLDHRRLEHGLVVQEPGQPGDPQRLTLLQTTGVLQVGRHVHVPVHPVFAPGRERPHRQQQPGVGPVPGTVHRPRWPRPPRRRARHPRRPWPPWRWPVRDRRLQRARSLPHRQDPAC